MGKIACLCWGISLCGADRKRRIGKRWFDAADLSSQQSRTGQLYILQKRVRCFRQHSVAGSDSWLSQNRDCYRCVVHCEPTVYPTDQYL